MDQHLFSGSAVQKAYRILTEQGTVISRPQSGFYVPGAKQNIAGGQHAHGGKPGDAHLYQQLAALIRDAIESGTLAPGARLPSVREVCETRGISISTAIQAYQLLAERGLIQARPRSGYFVTGSHNATLGLPRASASARKASTVSISNAVAVFLEYAHDPAYIQLGCAVPDQAFLRSDRLNAILARGARRNGAHHNTYNSARGCEDLRQEIARHTMRAGCAASPEDIIVTNGCTEAVTLALMTLVRRGDTVAVESPTYYGLLHTLEVLGIKVLEVATSPVRGVDVEALGKLADEHPLSAVVLASRVNNPLGCAMSEEDKIALLKVLKKRSLPLIEDDVYGDIYFGRERPRPFHALDPAADVTYCSSFSKTIAPGYRIGWVYSKRHAQRLTDTKLALNLCSPTLAQTALAEFMASGAYEAHLRKLRSNLDANLMALRRAVEACFPPDTKISRPHGGFALWVELRRGADTQKLFTAALERGICFTPGDIFSGSRRFKNCLRLSAGSVWDDRMYSSIGILGELLREQLIV
ncbi:PLP-dependent aminotransferase family protein [Achromobacter sp. Marseille-Q0513]|nr:PLP-dependent aminotransferase family protein [Achromobacter sp. Marseille-Q0513]